MTNGGVFQTRMQCGVSGCWKLGKLVRPIANFPLCGLHLWAVAHTILHIQKWRSVA